MPHSRLSDGLHAISDCRWAFSQHFNALAQESSSSIDGNLFVMPQSEGRQSVFHPPATQGAEAPAATPTIIVPGLLGDSVAAVVAPFVCARQAMAVAGYDTRIAWTNGRRSCDYNAAILRNAVIELANQRGRSVTLVGYSKGCADTLHMLARYPETHAAVHAVVSYGGVVLGSQLADEASWLTRKILQYIPLPGSGFGDGRAIADIRTAYRQQWLERNPLPDNVRYASVAALPSRHEVSRILQRSYDKLARIDPDNDSQLIWNNALIPGSELLALVRADHWALALPVSKRLPLLSRYIIDKNHFPRTLMLRAIIDYLASEPAQTPS